MLVWSASLAFSWFVNLLYFYEDYFNLKHFLFSITENLAMKDFTSRTTFCLLGLPKIIQSNYMAIH